MADWLMRWAYDRKVPSLIPHEALVEADLKDTREKLGETESSLKEAKDTVVKYVFPFPFLCKL